MPLTTPSHKNLLVSETDVKANAFIDGNVDAGDLRKAISLSQDLYLHPLLSTGLYDDLLKKVHCDELTDDDVYLLEVFIVKILALYAASELNLFSTYRQKQYGVGRQDDEQQNFNVAEIGEAKSISSENKTRAEAIADRMIKYIQANKSKYPAYQNCLSECSADIPGQKRASSFPIFVK